MPVVQLDASVIIKHQDLKAHGEAWISLHASFTFQLDVVNWTAAHHGCLPPGLQPPFPKHRRLRGILSLSGQ